MKDRLVIFDTTLRDGEQGSGASMTKEEKIRVARQLERMKVDVIEAGFAAASPGDFDAIMPSPNDQDSTVCSLAHCQRERHRPRRRGNPTGEIRPHPPSSRPARSTWKKLRMTPDQVVEQAVKTIGWARNYTDNVEFSAEDAGRSDSTSLCRIFEQVIKAGRRPSTSRIPSVTTARPVRRTIKQLIARVPNSTRWCGRCIATTTLVSLSPTRLAGCVGRRPSGRMHDQRSGERAGNASLEEIVMAVRTRAPTSSRSIPASIRRRSCRHPSWCRRSPATRCSRTRPWSAPTPSPTNPASTRTACSSTARPMRSCARRMSAGRRTSWCSASIPAAMPFQDASRRAGHRTRQRRSVERRFRPLQGARRQEARDFRRGPAGAGFDETVTPKTSTASWSIRASARKPVKRRRRRSP